ncbi:hypothetical protein B296_00055945, partial [Ensete ventricosum]
RWFGLRNPGCCLSSNRKSPADHAVGHREKNGSHRNELSLPFSWSPRCQQNASFPSSSVTTDSHGREKEEEEEEEEEVGEVDQMESSEDDDDFPTHEWITPQSSINSIYQSHTEKVADICRKMAAKRSESKGSSDSGGRKGQQRSQLRLRCDFVAADGVGCSKGAAVIGGRRGSDVHGCCGGGQQRLQRKIVAGSFLPQGLLLAVIKEDGSERSLLAALGIERCVLRLKG